jgi:hypothetical protein
MEAGSETPWSSTQVRVVVACDLIAVLLVAVAAFGAGDERSLQDQLTWINVAVLGLVAVVVANGALFTAARRAIGQRRLHLVPDVVRRDAPPPTTSSDERWLWVPGTTRAHRPGCPMTAGKPVEGVSEARIRAHNLSRCELCG